MAPKQTLIPGLDDDVVIAWWELYDSGLNLDQVAEEVKVHIGIIHIALGPEGLNVLDNARLNKNYLDENSYKAHIRMEPDEDIVQQARLGLLSAADQALYEAISKLGAFVDEEGSLPKRHLPFASALPHQVPQNLGRHSYHPMSGRQRSQDRLAAAKWRKIVAKDMRRSNIL